MNDTKVLIIDDEMVIARDLQRILRGMGLKRIEIANSSKEAFEISASFKPHLMLCDINMEEKKEDGISIAKKIADTIKTHTIFITAHAEQKYLERAGELDPLGYLLKPFKEEQVAASIKIALAKPEVQKGGEQKKDVIRLLTPSELKILKAIATGKTTSAIASELFISQKTVENHRANICRKLGLTGKSNSLLTWAVEHKNEL